MGGVLDLDLGDVPADLVVLVQRRGVPDRPDCCRAFGGCGNRNSGWIHCRRVDRLRFVVQITIGQKRQTLRTGVVRGGVGARLGIVPAVQRPWCLHSLRRSAGNNHGCQRFLRHHPGTKTDGGSCCARRGARSGTGHSRQAAFGA